MDILISLSGAIMVFFVLLPPCFKSLRWPIAISLIVLINFVSCVGFIFYISENDNGSLKIIFDAIGNLFILTSGNVVGGLVLIINHFKNKKMANQSLRGS